MLEVIFKVSVIVIFLLFILPVPDFMDCYDGYVEECLDCHSENLTYALCSGFCYEPEESDLTGQGCSVHPSQDCYEEIPDDYCVIQYWRWRYGILKLWGEETYWHGGY